MKILEELRRDWPMATEMHKLESRLWRIVRSERLNVILVTSALRGEGKSTTVAYLATALALHSDRRILVMDLDFRRPSLNDQFEMEPRFGIADALNGDCEIRETIASTELKGLDVVFTGKGAADPLSLIGSPSLPDIFEQLRASYDLVVIDSAPIIPVPDTATIMPLADGVVLTVMAGVTTSHHLVRARELCLGMGAKILGLVVGNVQEAAPEYMDHHYYAYPGRQRKDASPSSGGHGQSS